MALSRADVLAALSRRGRPALTVKVLLRQVGGRRNQLGELRGVLRSLAAEGAVERVDGRWRARRSDGLVEGVFHAARERPPQVIAEDDQLYAVVEPADARDGDRVLLLPRGGPGPQRGDVVHVLETRRREWVGILSRERTGGFITPYRDDVEWGLRVARDDLGDARDGDVVVAAAGRRRGGQPTGRVVEVLGPPGTPEADFRAVVWHRRLPVAFPENVLREAEAASPELDPTELARRVDLRERTFLTIDPETARDHDDAVCVEPLPNGNARLWVAIADVSYYVPEGSALDREALRRGNSVYFPDRAIPMLPERLSGDLCSLRPEVDRFVFCAELEIDPRGEVRRRSTYPAAIRSRAKLAYEEAAAILEGKGAPPGTPGAVTAQVGALGGVATRLRQRRFAAGSIDFDLPSASIVLGDDGHPVDIVRAPRNDAHRAIEEAMLAANRAVAETLTAAAAPALYRIHEPPTPADIETLREVLRGFHLVEGRARDALLTPGDIARALARAAGRPEERLVNLVALRAMRQARYAVQGQGHFALGFEHYTHFTSPIRRYADLVVHRALADVLAGDAAAQRRAEARAGGLEGVAARVSQRERLAEKAEREMVDLKQCAFMASRVGQEFDATVTSVAKHGLYVTLDEIFVDGLVHVSTMPGYAVFDERAHTLVVRGSRERFQLGDRFRVLLDAVDRVKAWINFSLVRRLA